MNTSSSKPAHKLGANRKEMARKSRQAHNSSESTDFHEDRSTMKSKFSQPQPTTARFTVPQRGSSLPQGSDTKPARWPESPMLLAEHTPGAEFHVVHLRMFKDGARNVCVAGTFNDWKPMQTPLRQNGVGEWEVDLSLAPGDYEYRFVVDGEWTDDPLSCHQVANPFGGVNAVLHVHGEEKGAQRGPVR
jgi:hypothetical protein